MKKIIILVGRECEKNISPILDCNTIYTPYLGRVEGDEPCGESATILRRLKELASSAQNGAKDAHTLLLQNVICRTDEALCLENYLKWLAELYEQIVLIEPLDFPRHRIGGLDAAIYKEELTK